MENETADNSLTTSTRLHIADICTSTRLSTHHIEAYVVLVWPYSSLTKELSLLLAERDVNLRRATGQVKVTFHNTCAEQVAASRVGIGEDVKLGLVSAQLIEENEQVSTPGRKAAFTLHYSKSVDLQIGSSDSDARHVEFTAEHTFSPSSSITNGEAGTVATPQDRQAVSIDVASHTATPTSHQKSKARLSSNSFPGSFVDPFTEEDGYTPGRGRKRTKFARHSGAWRLADTNVEAEESAQQGSGSPHIDADTFEPLDQHVDGAHVPISGLDIPGQHAVVETEVLDIDSLTGDSQDRSKSEHDNLPQPIPGPIEEREPGATFTHTIEPTTPNEEMPPSLGSESMLTPRLHALTSPGLPLVSPLYTRKDYFPTFERQMSELDASSHIASPSIIEEDSKLLGFSQEAQVASKLEIETLKSAEHLQQVELFVPMTAVLEAEVDLDALQEQISFELNEGTTDLGQDVTEVMEDEDLYGPPSTTRHMTADAAHVYSQGSSDGENVDQDIIVRGSMQDEPIVLDNDEDEEDNEKEEEEDVVDDEDNLEEEKLVDPVQQRHDFVKSDSVEDEEGSQSTQESPIETTPSNDELDKDNVNVNVDLHISKLERSFEGQSQAPSISSMGPGTEKQEVGWTLLANEVVQRTKSQETLEPTAGSQTADSAISDEQTVVSSVVAPVSFTPQDSINLQHPQELARESTTSTESEPHLQFHVRPAQSLPLEHLGFGFGLDRLQGHSTRVEAESGNTQHVWDMSVSSHETQLNNVMEEVETLVQPAEPTDFPATNADVQTPVPRLGDQSFGGDSTNDTLIADRRMAASESRRATRPSYQVAYPAEIYSDYFTPRRPAIDVVDSNEAVEEEIIEESSPIERSEIEEVQDRTATTHGSQEVNTATTPVMPTGVDLRRGTSTDHTYLVHLGSLEEHRNQVVDVLAVVATDSKEAERAKQGPKDFFTTMHLVDASLETDTSISVQIFRPRKKAIPVVQRGDVMLLRNFKVQSQKRKPYLLSNDESAWAVFTQPNAKSSSPKNMSVVISGPPLEYGEAEEELVEDGFSWWQAEGDDYPGPRFAAKSTSQGKQIQVPATDPESELRRSPRKPRHDHQEVTFDVDKTERHKRQTRSPSFVPEIPNFGSASRKTMPPPNAARHNRISSSPSIPAEVGGPNTSPKTPGASLDGAAASTMLHDDSANSESTTTKRHRKERRSVSLVHELRDGTQWVDVEEIEVVSVTTSEEDVTDQYEETASAIGNIGAKVDIAEHDSDIVDQDSDRDHTEAADTEPISNPRQLRSPGRPPKIRTPGKRGRPRRSRARRGAARRSPIDGEVEGRVTRNNEKAHASDESNVHELRDGAKYTD